MSSMLLLRGSPMAGESLSSFRQRIWKLNGYNLFPIFSPELRRSDPDLQRSSVVYDTVASRVGMSVEAVRRLTLWSHPLLDVGIECQQRLNPRWVVPLRYGSFGKGAGSMVCPQCLRDAKTAYFRNDWRFSTHLACPVHGCRLIECCPNCDMPQWPHGPTSLSTLFKDPHDLDECLHCRLKLSELPVEAEMCQDIIDCATATSAGVRITGWGPLEASLCEQFAALRALMGLALSIRTRTQMKLRRAEEFAAVIALVGLPNTRRSSFDRISANLRRLLILAACPLLKDWPHCFLDFSKRTQISLVDFSEGWGDLPDWMRSVIESELGQRGRFVSATDVQEGIELIVSQGKVPTMESVGKLVGSKGAKVVRDQLQKRTVATAQEFNQLVSGLRVGMEEGPTVRVTSSQTRARNVLAVLIAVFTEEPIARVLTWTREHISRAVSEAHTGRADDKSTLNLLHEAFLVADSVNSRGPAKTCEHPFFVSFRGGSKPSRGAAKMLRRAMQGMDSRLQRSAEVFFTNGARPIAD